MRRLALYLLLVVSAGARPSWFVEPALQGRIGFDTNPVAAGGSAAPVLGTDDALTFSAGLSFAVASPAAPGRPSGKLTYAGEVVRYDSWASENYTSHRFGASTQATAGAWSLSAEGSSLFVDGSRDTLLSLAACNGNSTALWRERRAQWQHRAKLLAVREAGAFRVRISTTLLDYDYLTRVASGRVAFADRSDFLTGVDAGWKPSPRSFWFAGARLGTQHQDQVPLPGGSVDYSSRYTRLVAGWEGKLGANTTLALAAGPDFRHFNGTIDPKVFRGRDRTLFWFDGTATMKLSPRVGLAAKATRWAWLSSTGKSAYTDFCADFTLTWTVNEKLTLRATAKAHQCSYFPVVRNDWEMLDGVGLTYKASPTVQLFADVLYHRGWNELPGFADRGFTRAVLSFGTTVKL